jgi:hypothetical protein
LKNITVDSENMVLNIIHRNGFARPQSVRLIGKLINHTKKLHYLITVEENKFKANFIIIDIFHNKIWPVIALILLLTISIIICSPIFMISRFIHKLD